MAVNEDVNGVPRAAQVLLDRLRACGKKSFRLAWKGTKIPRGAKVDGLPITWTQHGVVYVDDQGRQVGYYARTKEWAGEDGDEHEMLISTDGNVEAGFGQTVELIRNVPITLPIAS